MKAKIFATAAIWMPVTAKTSLRIAATGRILTQTATNFAMTDSTATRTNLVFSAMTRTLAQTGATFATMVLTRPNINIKGTSLMAAMPLA